MKDILQSKKARKFGRSQLFMVLAGLALALPNQKSYCQHLDWARYFTGTNARADGVTVDRNGNVYAMGYFTATADFNPLGTPNLLNASSGTGYITKSDKNGNLVWAKQIEASVAGYQILADSFGSVYINGNFWGTGDLEPGPGVQTFSTTAVGETFLIKLDTSGNFRWAKVLQTAAQNEPVSMATNAKGDLFITGWFTGTADFDPGAGTYTMTSSCSSTFLEKLDSAGNFSWVKQIGTATPTEPPASCNNTPGEIAFDGSGNIYVSGAFSDTIDFDPGPGTYLAYSPFYVGSPQSAGYLSKLDSTGNFQWVRIIKGDPGVPSSCAVSCVVVDNSGSIYLNGLFRYTIDLDPGTARYAVTSPPSAGGDNSFLVKLDAGGNFVWGYNTAATVQCWYTRLLGDNYGYIYNAGFYTGNIDMDPGSGVVLLTSTSGSTNYFIQKLDTNGNFTWVINSGPDATLRDIAIDGKKNIYAGGDFTGICDFDPGPAVVAYSTPLTTAYSWLLKLNQTLLDSLTSSSCGSITIDGVSYSSSGTYLDTLLSSIGSDSLLTITLTVNPIPFAGVISGPDTVCIGASITLSESLSGGLWTIVNANATITDSLVTGVANGVDTVIYTFIDGATGCRADTQFTINVQLCDNSGTKQLIGRSPALRMMPNPCEGVFQIDVSSQLNEPLDIRITNAMGVEVKTMVSRTNHEETVQLDAPPGIYFVNVSSATDHWSQKLLIQ